MTTSSRKDDHLKINLTRDVRSGLGNGFDAFHFIHQALPEIDLSQVEPSVMVFGKKLVLPILISSMTGGSEKSFAINQVLAKAAQKAGIAMGLGSMRAALEHPEFERTFKVRSVAPDILLFANIGAVQLNYSYTIEHCKRLIDMVEADGLILHLNPLQEALQPEGDTNFAGLLKKIGNLCHQLKTPIIVKEVGWGMDGKSGKKLAEAGVAAIDVAGAGGTSWSQVEMYRQKEKILADVASSFKNWGIPTADSLIAVHNAVPGLPLIASGGLLDGIDLAKCIAMGAKIGGFAGLFFRAAEKGEQQLAEEIDKIGKGLKIAMFATGNVNLDSLSKTRLVKNWNF